MKMLLDNIIKDNEPEDSLILKKKNIRQLANEFVKEEIIRVNLLKKKGEKVEHNPKLDLLEMAHYLDDTFRKK